MNRIAFRLVTLVTAILVLITAIIFSPQKYLAATRSFAQKFYSRGGPVNRVDTRKLHHLTTTSSSSNMTTKTPIYFLSHGGPNVMYEKDHPVYPQLQKIGKEITEKVKPKAIVVFSAHWQGERDVIEINTSENTNLIYDFYGFPSHYYKETYPNKGSPTIAQKVIDTLTSSGIKTQGLRRGLDHGVWASFKVLFSPETNPLNIPIVQVSLFANEDPAQHIALGRAVSSLRSEGICLIMSGMAVHNLRDMRFGSSIQPYSKTFDEALKEAVETEDSKTREGKMVELLWRSDARRAHPTFEHLLPIHVGVGAAAGDRGKRLWTLVEGSFSWAQYRFGEVPAAA